MPVRTLPLALAILLVLLPQGAAAETSTRIIVKREPGLSASERADIRADADVRLIRSLSLPRTELVTASRGDADEALDELRANKDVVYAEVDHRRRAFAVDPFMDRLWALENVGQYGGTADADSDVVDAWDLVTDLGSGQTVAVVDTGVVASHEDLAGRIGERRNFVDGDPANAADINGHGTHVTGTIVANRDNGTGIAGVAPNATVMALRVLDDDGGGYDSDIAEAFRYAGQQGVRVVNASLGGPGGGETLRAAIASSPQTLFVVAAGNGGADSVGDNNDAAPQYPCNVPEPNVLCIGASTNRDERAAFSNVGAQSVDLFAPGQFIYSTVPPWEYRGEIQHYAFESGTSMAAPHVAGTAALVMDVAPELDPVELKQILMVSGDAKGAFDDVSVTGRRLNASAAVQLAIDGESLPDGDGDGWADAADACPSTTVLASPDGCPLDDDWDGVVNATDNCDVTSNPQQADLDGDGIGDACDPSPRGHDADGDGKPAVDDACPNVYGTLPNGCPAPPPPPNGDGDGFIDAQDACPFEAAFTANGCPVPALTALSGKVTKRGTLRWVTVRARTTRAATLRILVQRKSGRRWVKVKRRTLATTANRVRLKVSRLRRGRHRVVVAVYSSAGVGTPATRYFTVR